MTPADFPALAQSQQAIARRNQTVRNLVYLAGVLLGLLVGLSWLILWPQHGPSPQDKLAIGFVGGLAASSLWLWAGAQTLFPQAAQCPACGHDWEIKEGRSVPARERMPNWSKCPGCGAEMASIAAHAQPPC